MGVRIEGSSVGGNGISGVVRISDDQVSAWGDMDEFEEALLVLKLPVQLMRLRDHTFLGWDDVDESLRQRLVRRVENPTLDRTTGEDLDIALLAGARAHVEGGQWLVAADEPGEGCSRRQVRSELILSRGQIVEGVEALGVGRRLICLSARLHADQRVRQRLGSVGSEQPVEVAVNASDLTGERRYWLAVALLPQDSKGRTGSVDPACGTTDAGVRQAVVAHERLDKVSLARLKRNTAISAAAAGEYINLF